MEKDVLFCPSVLIVGIYGIWYIVVQIENKGGIRMWYELYEEKWLIYAIFIAGGIGLLGKLVVAFTYGSLVRASNEMGSSQNKLMKLLCLKFETFYKLKIGVNNVDTFVDKYVYKQKFCGIGLSTWENFSGQMTIICLAGAVLGSIWGYFLHCGQHIILFTFLCGMSVAMVLIVFEGLVDIRGKKARLRLNMRDYLENYLKAKLENEHLTPEMLETYRQEYFEGELSGLEKNMEKRVKQKQKKLALQEETAAVQEKIIEEILKEYLA